MTLNPFTLLCNHYHHWFPEVFHLSKWRLYFLSGNSPIPTLSPWTTTILLLPGFWPVWLPQKWNHVIPVLLCLAYPLFNMSWRFIHVVACRLSLFWKRILPLGSYWLNMGIHMFMCLFTIYVASVECLFMSSAHFLVGLLFYCWVFKLTYILWMLIFCPIYGLQIFSLSS